LQVRGIKIGHVEASKLARYGTLGPWRLESVSLGTFLIPFHGTEL
jgi:hypothetical protein